MNPKLIWANYSVKSATRTHEFYSKLGFVSNTPPNSTDLKLASFFFGENNFVIHFFEENSGQIDKYIQAGSESDGIIFTLSADTEQEVQEFERLVKEAGGKIIQPLIRDENNYYGFAFTDPDGHKFNVLLMDNM